MSDFIHEPIEFGYSDLTTTNVDGLRMYETPEGSKYPSVTTVLGIRNKEGIKQWRARVGEEEANRISSFAASRGTRVHTMMERYLDNRDDYLEKSNHITKQNFNALKKVADTRISSVVAQEKALYSDYLGLAGRVDCVGVFDSKLSIVDFKTSFRPKMKNYISGYFIQETAYAIAFEERTGVPVSQIVTIIANDEEPDEPQVFIEKRDNWVQELYNVIDEFHESLK